MKLVSVIIPFYNTDESVFAQCLNSINDSVYKDIEIIIVDDGSRKALADFLDGIPLKFVDLQVHVFHQKNSGPSAARNLGMKKASGDFILFIDSDDLISQNYISALVENISFHGSDIAYGNMQLIDANGIILENDENKKTVNKHDFSLNTDNDCISQIINAMWNTGCIPIDFPNDEYWMSTCVWGKLFTKHILDDVEFDEDLVNGEDQIFTYDVLQKTKKISFTNNGFYYYRMNDSSIMHTASENTIERYLNLYAAIRSRVYSDTELYQRKLEHEVRALFRIMTDNISFSNYRKLVKYLYCKDEFQKIRMELSIKYSDGVSAKTIIMLIKLGWTDAIYFMKRIKLKSRRAA